MDIRNKIFIVSGGANGLGKAITLGLVDCGARVIVIDKDQESMKDFDKIKSVICYKCNFLIPNKIENVFKKINIDYPIIDGLINNAGIISLSVISLKMSYSSLYSSISLSKNSTPSSFNIFLKSTQKGHPFIV